MAKVRSTPDFLIIGSTLALLALGVVMVYSASAVTAFHDYGDTYYYLKRQLIFAVLGIIGMYVMMNIDYWSWKPLAKTLLIICFVMLIIVLIPGVGVVRGGARSWLGIGSFGVQPQSL